MRNAIPRATQVLGLVMALALAAYPEARVVVNDKCVTLRPSRPSIAKR